MERKRQPGYITQQVSNDFGLDVKVQRQVAPNSEFYSSGDPVPEGEFPDGENMASDRRYREVIPPGTIGSVEGQDLDILTPPQRLDTVQDYPGAQRDPSMHRAVHSLRMGAETQVPFQNYAKFQPRSAPMPRAAQDQIYLEGYGRNAADPRMTDESASVGLQKTDKPDRAPLYGDNRDGVLHNENHPGFKAVQGKIEKEGYSKEAAGAILANSTRHASKAAHKANPRLNRVK